MQISQLVKRLCDRVLLQFALGSDLSLHVVNQLPLCRDQALKSFIRKLLDHDPQIVRTRSVEAHITAE